MVKINYFYAQITLHDISSTQNVISKIMRKTLLTLFSLFVLGASAVYSQERQSGNLTVRKLGEEPAEEQQKSYRTRITLGGGYTYRLGKIEKSGYKDADDFMKGLRNGFNLDFDFQNYFDDSWGLGLNISYALQSKKHNGDLSIPGGVVYDYKESHSYIYVGPQFVARAENDKWGFYMGAGIGPIFYFISAKERRGKTLDISKTAFGSYLGLAGEYRITQSFGVGLKLSAIAGMANVPELGNDKQNVSNFHLTGFISFRPR